MPCISRSECGASFSSVFCSSQSMPVHCIKRTGARASRVRNRDGKILQHHETLQCVERLEHPARLQLGHECAERLDQFAVLHAGRAGRLAGPAIEAEIEVLLDRVVEFELAVDHVAHQVNAAARAIGLVAGFDVGRTRGRA